MSYVPYYFLDEQDYQQDYQQYQDPLISEPLYEGFEPMYPEPIVKCDIHTLEYVNMSLAICLLAMLTILAALCLAK
jgi:hypothetical protein